MSRTTRTETTKQYEPVAVTPVARFYYQGSHSHPVRRTVLVVDETPTVITGYEMRSGRNIRSFGEAKIRSYRKDLIAKYGDYSRLRRNRTNYSRLDSESTLTRTEMFDLVKNGA
jgi:hypothetical protein